jgi:hypothetical protein
MAHSNEASAQICWQILRKNRSSESAANFGQARPAKWLTEEEVAARLMVSTRVLRLRLAEAGSIFRAILDELR